MKKSILVVLFAALISFPAFLYATHEDPATIAKRSAPVGQVYRTGDKIEKVAVVAETAPSSGPRTAADIYTKCSACHNTGAANAPIVGNKEQWAPRIAKGLDALVSSAINGTPGGMPPKGMCMDCSNDEIKATVEYMLEKSQ
jgi:cytochrome c5